jgi:hypothetical protein
MKMSIRAVLLSSLFAVLALALVGCSTTKKPKVDWASRVGNYTYDQAVEELGPPDKQATLTDGGIVAEWIKQTSTSGSSIGFGLGGGSYGGGSGMGAGVGVSQSMGSSTPGKVLRLTFGPDKKLIEWSKNY